MIIKLDNVWKPSIKEEGKAVCINYTVFLSWFCQRPTVPDRVKYARKILFKTIEIAKRDSIQF